jgi:hypothetical protein
MLIRNVSPFFASLALLVSSITPPASAGQISGGKAFRPPQAKFSKAVAVDVSPTMHSLAAAPRVFARPITSEREVRRERGPVAKDRGFSGDAAVQASTGPAALASARPSLSPLLTFEGLSNQDNFDIFGFRVNPPDPVGAVGRNHYVQMVNLTFAVYDKQGNRLLGPVDTGSLWQGFAVPDCTDPSGDPIVLYDRFEDRWLLSQFTTSGLNPDGSYNGKPFYNCVAISQTGDPTGAYYRYAFSTSAPGSVTFFPDYPKYGVWGNSYLLTSRDFGPTVEYGISVYALEKQKMLRGDPNARAVHFFLDSAVVPLEQIGDGLLPADIDGENVDDEVPAPIVGTMDDGAGYGATFDALNVYELSVRWRRQPTASLKLSAQLPVVPFDSIFPCGVVSGSQPPSARDCLPEPGITDGSRFLDILSYRQRPTWRLAYRKFDDYEAMVTNQSVEAAPSVAGVRWYEIRRKHGRFSVFQQGTYAPNDGVHRWMGSAAMDRKGNIALGYSVVNGIDVFPGIRYTGRLKGDPRGQMTLGEGTIVNGTGVQVTTNSRWGDYTSMNVDPTDDCTFWYVNEYYQINGIIGVNTAPWQTRIGSFQLPGCSRQDKD